MEIEMKRLPHDHVFVRLRRSRRHGVGVFAIRAIKKGTAIFDTDDDPICWIDAKKLRGLPKAIRNLYDDFGIIDGDRYGCPRNFNQLTPAWYLNESKRPNVRCDDNYQFWALRDIRADEELTVDYDTYSDRPRAIRHTRS
jgi:SET domain-containing protein